MLVSILLDQPPPHYTNLDTISGRVLLRATSNTTVSSIIVKLEGESRTRLIPPPRPDYPNKQQRPVLEIHKARDHSFTDILYKTAVVFPPPNLQTLDWESHKYTLNVGEYEYPFAFKLPFNNACHTTNSLTGGLNIATLEIARPPTRHVKQTLPPSLTGYPGEAEVKYFVKCTVNRPSLLKENPRSFVHFNFLPIEPPRPQKADGEVYARRQHQFNPKLIPGPERKKPPRFSIDARLPNPAILTLNDDLPLRVLVKQLNERTEPVYLQMFQIELIGYTQVRAHEIMRTESNSWIIASFSNMAIPLGAPSDVPGTEVPINPEYWSDKPLPNTVAPTFETCNLSRYYELEVRVGLGYATYRHGLDQLIVLPLRLPVKVFSGIEPPPALLAAMADPSKAAAAAAGSPNGIPPRKPVPGGMTASPYYAPSSPSPIAPGYEDAPPSYEDAIATNLPPVNGPRRDYAPPPVPEGAPRFSSDEKR
ncbi:arrestin [Phyllosticta paracitricarpa]|uniref:Arrestin n=1 Tax=Phyllosticta paracitricarpa TaxID=2016321 RepID=A0ABR1NAL1_9PEZI